MKIITLALISVIILSAPVLSISKAQITVFIPDIPKIVLPTLTEQDQGLLCSWYTEDYDEDETLITEVTWKKDGETISTDTPACLANQYCSSFLEAETSDHEVWKCQIKITDKYNQNGQKTISLEIQPPILTGYFIAGSNFITDILAGLLFLFN